jgi:hypothetical protein
VRLMFLFSRRLCEPCERGYSGVFSIFVQKPPSDDTVDSAQKNSCPQDRTPRLAESDSGSHSFRLLLLGSTSGLTSRVRPPLRFEFRLC